MNLRRRLKRYNRVDSGSPGNSLTNKVEPEHPALAKVGEQEISPVEILHRIVQMQNWSVIQDALDSWILTAALEQNAIKVTDDEIYQQAMHFRQQNGLLTGADVHKWLESHHQSEEDFLEMCKLEIEKKKLIDKLFANKIAEYFAYKKTSLISVELYKIIHPQEEVIRELLSSIKEGASFFNYAKQHSKDESAKSCGYSGLIKLEALSPAQQDLISKAKVGDCIGPIKLHNNWEIYLLESKTQAVLDEKLKEELKMEMFNQWMAETRTRSRIEYSI